MFGPYAFGMRPYLAAGIGYPYYGGFGGFGGCYGYGGYGGYGCGFPYYY